MSYGDHYELQTTLFLDCFVLRFAASDGLLVSVR